MNYVIYEDGGIMKSFNTFLFYTNKISPLDATFLE